MHTPLAATQMKRAQKGAAHDAWFRQQVQASIDDPRASVDDDTARRQFAAKRAAIAKQATAKKRPAP